MLLSFCEERLFVLTTCKRLTTNNSFFSDECQFMDMVYKFRAVNTKTQFLEQLLLCSVDLITN